MKCFECGKEINPGDNSRIVSGEVHKDIAAGDKKTAEAYVVQLICSECQKKDK